MSRRLLDGECEAEGVERPPFGVLEADLARDLPEVFESDQPRHGALRQRSDSICDIAGIAGLPQLVFAKR